jgi:hypothetical protein
MIDQLLDPNVDPDSLLQGLRAKDSAAAADAAAPARSTAMLELHHKQGHRHAIPYMHLLWIAFNPSRGIKLHFATHTVRIRGRNLGPLYEQLAAHACRVLREVDPSEDTGEEDATSISEIVFRPIGRGRASAGASEERNQSRKQERKSCETDESGLARSRSIKTYLR